MVAITLPPPPVVRFAPLRLVPPPAAEKVERHICEQEAVAEVRRALNVWAYTSESADA